MTGKKAKHGLIKSRKRVKERGEVFTPAWLVRDMVDLVPDIDKPETTVLEPSCGTGNFLVEILGRKLKRSETFMDRVTSLSSLYGVDIMEDNVAETKERLAAMFGDRELALRIMEPRIVCGNTLTGTLWRNGEDTGERIWFLKD